MEVKTFDKEHLLKQEKEVAEFLRNNGIAFAQHKRWVGHGGKTWITDFYLPEHNIIIECKSFRSRGTWQTKGLELVYKDLYKMDELEERYGVTKVLLLDLDTPLNIIPYSFMPNLLAHRIYFIIKADQILPIIQGQTMKKNNSDLAGKFIGTKEDMILKTKIPEVFRPRVLEQATKDIETLLKEMPMEFQILFEYTNGKSTDDLVRLHPELRTRKDVIREMRKALTVLVSKYSLDQISKQET